MNDTESPSPPSPATESPAVPEPGTSLLRLDDPDATAQRIRLTAIASTLILTIGVAMVTRSPWQVLGTLSSATLMLLNFQGLMSVTDALLDGDSEGPSTLQVVFLVGRYALLAIVLCAIVLAPGVGPIPVALGLSVLVIAILLEAIFQLFRGASRRP